MIKATVLFVGAFGLSAALGSIGAGCSSDDCDCPFPDLPPVTSNLRISSVMFQGDAAPIIHPQGGTFTSRGATIMIRYEETGVMHEVVYAIDGRSP